MPEIVREWPHALDHALKGMRPVSGLSGCYVVDADLSKDEVLLLNLFEARSRIGRISFRDPATCRTYTAYMTTPMGLGPARQAKDGAVRVRIPLTDVHPH